MGGGGRGVVGSAAELSTTSISGQWKCNCTDS